MDIAFQDVLFAGDGGGGSRTAVTLAEAKPEPAIASPSNVYTSRCRGQIPGPAGAACLLRRSGRLKFEQEPRASDECAKAGGEPWRFA